MRTRSSAPHPSEGGLSSNTIDQSNRSSKIFILPADTSDEARFLMLPNPRTGALTRYFFCPKRGLYEFTTVGSGPHLARSVLFAPKPPNADKSSAMKGNVIKNAQLLVATPIDVMFFLIPVLSLASTTTKGLFQPLDDMIDSQEEFPVYLRHVLYEEGFRIAVNNRADATCDTVEAGDERMFRFSESKLLKELIRKAERMVAQGLPLSLEERFVQQALAMPLMTVKREATIASNTSSEDNRSAAAGSEHLETQSTATKTSDVSSTSTPTLDTESIPTPPAGEDYATPPEIAHLLRLSTALAFMKESYLAPDLCAKIDALLETPGSPVDFNPLKAHLKYLAELRAEALASRAATDFSRKRSLDGEEAAQARAEKKQREEEEKKKATESRAVRDLRKVNTSGMKKMSDFFARASSKKKN